MAATVADRTDGDGQEVPVVVREGDKARVDREFMELLNELRVAVPGIQVLFAFLLVVPFNQRFTQLSGFEESVYFGALIASALASLFLIAPSAYHRARFAEGAKERVLRVAHWEIRLGLFCLAVAIVLVVFLIPHFLFGPLTAIVTAGVVGGLFVIVWQGLPLLDRIRANDRQR
jgi:hypothetical protein